MTNKNQSDTPETNPDNAEDRQDALAEVNENAPAETVEEEVIDPDAVPIDGRDPRVKPLSGASVESTTAEQASSSKWGIGVLVVAVLLAGGAIAWRALDGGSEAEAVAAAAEDEGPVPIGVLQERAEADPMNAQAWQELGFAHSERGEYEEAARAYRQAIEGDGDSAVLWSALGEMRIYASESDPMPANAVSAFQQAVKLDPADSRARYFLAVKKDLEEDHAGALADWTALLEDTPPGAPWEARLRQTIEEVGKINNINTDTMIANAVTNQPGAELTAGNAIPGPNEQQINAASAIPAGEQRDMAESMVERLEGRLAGAPENVEGWVMLMRSRMTLGQPDKASKALADAIAANPGDADRLRQEAEILSVP